MAINEHKNLDDANRHQPKGFESAANDTVLSKDIGTGTANTDGSLEYQSKNLMGSVDYTIIGYIAAADYSNANYYRAAHITDGQSPFQYNVDTSQTAVTSITIQPANLITRSSNLVVDSDSNVYKITGWINSSGTDTVTLAIAKVTPTADDTSNMNPVVIDEIAVTGLGNSQKLVRINETTITSASLTAGDYLIAFIKDAGAGSNTIYWQVKICTTKY